MMQSRSDALGRWIGLVAAPLCATCLVLTSTGIGPQQASSPVQLERDRQACRAAKALLKSNLPVVLRDFDAAGDPVPLATLVSIDARIRALLRDRPDYRPCETDRELIYDAEWERIGLTTGYWDDLAYSGRLLVRAHRESPHSPLRKHTLFSTVFGETPSHGLGVMPDLYAAYAYAAEFPDGPFVTDAYRTIAGVHKDLFMVLRDRRKDYKYDCYARYITPEDWRVQEARAQRTAVDYYERLVRLEPGDRRSWRYLDDTRKGVVRDWSFCAD